VREHVHRRYPPPAETVGRAAEHYAGLAREYGPRVGGRQGADAAAHLVAEAANLETALLEGLASADPRSAVRAARALAKLVRVGALGSPALLEAAGRAARASHDAALEAAAAEALGDVALARGDRERARAQYQEALLLHERVRDLLGQAGCIERLA